MARKQSPPSLQDDIQAIVSQVNKGKASDKRQAGAPLRKRRYIAGGVLLACLALAALAFGGVRDAARESLVEIAALLDPAHLWRVETKRWEPAQVREAVVTGDVVRTGRGGGVHLHFPDNTMVKIGPDATFGVRYSGYDRRTGGRHRQFDLYSGRMWARVSKFVSSDSSFDVNTPTALAGVRGTRFSVLVYKNSGNPALPDGATYISVSDGIVRVMSRGVMRATLVRAGQNLLVLPNLRNAPLPSPMSPAEQQAWQQQRNDPTGDVLAESPSPMSDSLVNFQEQVFARPVTLVGSALHIPGAGGEEDQQAAAAPLDFDRSEAVAIARANTAARALQIALEGSVDSSGNYPAAVGLSDLAGLQLDPTKVPNILNSIDGKRLLTYRRVGNRYILDIRARMPSGALIEVEPDSIKTLEDVSVQ